MPSALVNLDQIKLTKTGLSGDYTAPNISQQAYQIAVKYGKGAGVPAVPSSDDFPPHPDALKLHVHMCCTSEFCMSITCVT